MVEMADTQESCYNPTEWVSQNICVGTRVARRCKSEITQTVYQTV